MQIKAPRRERAFHDLGTHEGCAGQGQAARRRSRQSQCLTEATAARDADLRPILEAMQDKPYRDIAQSLTDCGIKTPRAGDVRNQVTVMRVMKRLGIAGK
jgi:hypothetical protein